MLSDQEVKKEEGKRKRKAEKKPSLALELRKHTLDEVMIDLDRFSRPLERLEREYKRKHMKGKKEE